MNDKKTWLAVGLSAAALLVGYIAYKTATSDDDGTDAGVGSITADNIDDKIQEAIDELGSITREDNSEYLDFDYFLKIFEISQMFARMSYASEKVDKLEERRNALKSGDEKLYEQIALEMMQAEEQLTNDKLVDILDRLSID